MDQSMASLRVFLFGEDPVNRGIEEIAVSFDVDAFGVGSALYHVKPAGAIRLFSNEFDVVTQSGVAAAERSIRDAINIRDRFETFDRADDLTGVNGRARVFFPLMIDDLAEHSRGEFRESNPPPA